MVCRPHIPLADICQYFTTIATQKLFIFTLHVALANKIAFLYRNAYIALPNLVAGGAKKLRDQIGPEVTDPRSPEVLTIASHLN